jgi:hypothetical protein
LGNGYEAVYDDVLNITWLADANLSSTQGFGLPVLSRFGEEIGIYPEGRMSYATAKQWLLRLNQYGGTGWLGNNTWRLPKNTPLNDVFFVQDHEFDGSTDVGSNIGAPIGASNPNGKSPDYRGSELAYHYYMNFGGRANCYAPAFPDTGSCLPEDQRGIDGALDPDNNRSYFKNLRNRFDPNLNNSYILHWSKGEFDFKPFEVSFMFFWASGRQATSTTIHQVWPVADGDIFGGLDSDGDGALDTLDNCPETPNPTQIDSDGDGLGDICDPFPFSENHIFAQCESDRDQLLDDVGHLSDVNAGLESDLAACDKKSNDQTLLIEEQVLKIRDLNAEIERLKGLRDSDADGIPDEADLCPNTSKRARRIYSDGCSVRQRWNLWFKNYYLTR